MSISRVGWCTGVSPLVTLLLILTLSSCGSATPDHAASPSTSTQPPPHVLERLSSIQRHNFALLRTAPEGLPASVRSRIAPTDAAMNPALAQRIPVTVPGSYWLIPGIGYLCVVSEVPWTVGIAAICARTQTVIRHGTGTITFVPAGQAPARTPTRLLIGVAPDDARTALVRTGRSVASVPVVDGVFVLRDSMRRPSDSIELRRTG